LNGFEVRKSSARELGGSPLSSTARVFEIYLSPTDSTVVATQFVIENLSFQRILYTRTNTHVGIWVRLENECAIVVIRNLNAPAKVCLWSAPDFQAIELPLLLVNEIGPCLRLCTCLNAGWQKC
jgi:hypothetical protein